MPLLAINVSYNKVRIPGIVTFFMGIGNIFLAVILSSFTSWGYYGIAIAGAIMLTLKNAFFTPWYATKVLGISRTTFVSSILQGALIMLIISGISKLISFFTPILGLETLIIYGIIETLAYVSILWIFFLKDFERQLILSMLPSSIKTQLEIKINSFTK
jgi:membrane protein EpsK